MKKQIIFAILALIVVIVGMAFLFFPRVIPPVPISEADIESVLLKHGIVADVRVENRSIGHAGTRSESAVYSLSVNDFLFGEAATSLVAGRFVQGQKHYLSVGRRYLVVIYKRDTSDLPLPTYALGLFEPYHEGRANTVRQWLKKASDNVAATAQK